MRGTHIIYYGNLYQIKKYNNFVEGIEVTLIKQFRNKLCANAEHAVDLAEGIMWPSYFFSKAKIADQAASLLYVSDT